MKTGVSIFVGLEDYSMEDNLKYLSLAHKNNYEIVFTSAHIDEASKAYEDLIVLAKESKKLGMKLCIDVSKRMMDTFTFFDDIYSLRLDFGFSDNEIVELSKNAKCKIELNASTIDEKYLLKLINLGLNTDNVRASFNYYPKLYTGHDIEDVENKVKMFHQYHISVNAFLPSKVGKRPPMYEGLPTVEKHRYFSLRTSIEELKAAGLDEISFGDAYASEDELKLLSSSNVEEIVLDVTLCDNLQQQYLDNILGSFFIRSDYNSYLLRVTSKRGKVSNIMKENTIERKKYSLTIDNENFKRYQGEINIVLKDIIADERVNVIGFVDCTEFLENKIRSNKKIKLNLK